MNRMNGLVFLVAGLLFVTLLTSCAHVSQNGAIITAVGGPISIANTNDYHGDCKIGTASSFSLLGLFAFGDAGTQKAMENSGVSEIFGVDYYYTSLFLGLFTKYTTIIRGKGKEEEKTETMEAPKKNIDNN